MTNFNESHLVGFLYNLDCEVKIPLHLGVNIITSDYFKELKNFSFLKRHYFVLFKLNLHSSQEASLRTFDGFNIKIAVSDQNVSQDLTVNKSSVKIINILNNFEISVFNSSCNFGTFKFDRRDFDSYQDEKNANKLEVIDLRTESGTGDAGINSTEEGEIKKSSYQSDQNDNLQDNFQSNFQKFQNNQTNYNHNYQNNLQFNLENIELPKFSQTQGKNSLEELQEEEDQIVYFSKNFEEISENLEKSTEMTEKNENSHQDHNCQPSLEFSEDFSRIVIPKIFLKSIYDELLEIKNRPKLSEIKILGKRKRDVSENSKNSKNSKIVEKNVIIPQSTLQTCTICLESIKLPSKVTGCEHIFCKECIDQWAAMSNTCPLCKKDFKKIIYYDEQEKIIGQRNVKKRKFKYEDEENDTWVDNCLEYCMKCKKTKDVYLMLVCDKCRYNVCHTYCAGLDIIPDEDWFCTDCEPRKEKEIPNGKNKSLGKKNLPRDEILNIPQDNKKYKKRKIENGEINTISTRSHCKLPESYSHSQSRSQSQINSLRSRNKKI